MNVFRISDTILKGGLIVDSLNQLSSFYGQYSPETKLAVFNDSVQVENPDFTLYSDTLHYDTESKVATIWGRLSLFRTVARSILQEDGMIR